MIKITITLILSTLSLALFSPDFQVPKNYKLDKAEDYAQYEKDIINCVDWLIKTPINEQEAKRKEANAFLIVWLTGSPNVTIEVKQEIVSFMGSSPDLLVVFMGGWAKYSIETKDYENKVEGNYAGICSVIDFYSNNISIIKKDKNVEKYIKMKKKGTLKEFIEKNA